MRVPGYLRFLIAAFALTGGMALLGAWPTERLGGAGAIPAMIAGCATGLLAAALGAIPIALAASRPPAARLQAALLAIGLRFLAVLVLGLAVAESGWFARRPLVTWVGLCYAALLVLESRYAMRAAGAGGVDRAPGSSRAVSS